MTKPSLNQNPLPISFYKLLSSLQIPYRERSTETNLQNHCNKKWPSSICSRLLLALLLQHCSLHRVPSVSNCWNIHLLLKFRVSVLLELGKITEWFGELCRRDRMRESAQQRMRLLSVVIRHALRAGEESKKGRAAGVLMPRIKHWSTEGSDGLDRNRWMHRGMWAQ